MNPQTLCKVWSWNSGVYTMYVCIFVAVPQTAMMLLSYLSGTHWYGDLTHWGRVTHICVDKLTIIGSDNGLSPEQRQAIIWTNAGIFLIRLLGTNFSEILIEIQTFSFKKMHLKISSAKWRPFCLRLNVLISCKYRHSLIIPGVMLMPLVATQTVAVWCRWLYWQLLSYLSSQLNESARLWNHCLLVQLSWLEV